MRKLVIIILISRSFWGFLFLEKKFLKILRSYKKLLSDGLLTNWSSYDLAWLYIIYEIWAGEAKEKVSETSEGTQFAFKAMALILTFGWAIYPLGYYLGMDSGASDNLNILYNIADVVNKTAFGLMVWYAATMDSKSDSSEEWITNWFD